MENLSSYGDSSTSSSSTDAVIFFGFSLVMGMSSTHLLRSSKLPYTVALLILGIALGSLEYSGTIPLGKLGNGIRLWANIDPDLLLAIFLPVLIFEGSFTMEVHQIKRCMIQMLLLAGPGVFISTFCIGSALKLIFPYEWNWKTFLLLGAILSATDPVAVVALLKELSINVKLSTIIKGESMMNDGASIVVFQLFYRMVFGQSFDLLAVLKFLTIASVGAVGIGIVFGVASIFWLGFTLDDAVIELSLMLAVNYIAYFTAQEVAGVSGILTTVTLGMVFAAAKSSFKTGAKQSLLKFWEVITYIANTLIFIVSGIIIAQSIYQSRSQPQEHGNMWGYLFLLYVFVQVSRGLVVILLYPALRYFGYGLNWREATIVVWSGLRGAVSLALSLSVKRGSGDPKYLDSETGNLFVFYTGGIVLLTLIINGSTAQFLLSFFRMDALSESERYELRYAKCKLLRKAEEVFANVRDDAFGVVDWPTVESYLMCLRKINQEAVQVQRLPITDNYMDPIIKTGIRVRFLKASQAAYLRMLDEGKIDEATVSVLIDSTETAIDLASEGPLCDWNCLLLHIKLPKYLNHIPAIRCSRQFVLNFAVSCLQSACFKCLAFLRAHRIARRELEEFFGENDVSRFIIEESRVEEEAAVKYVEDVKCTFPEILHDVRAKEVTWSILESLTKCVENFENFGLLDKKVSSHLHDLVQTDLHKLSSSSPRKILKLSKIINMHPFLGFLPPPMCDALKHSASESITPPGTIIYQGGSNPDKIWLIVNGLIKSESDDISSNSSNIKFHQGSILGLYEALAGKPYVCNMLADLLGLCISFEVKEILPLIQSSHDAKNLFWKESAIVMIKLRAPQIFEKISMQEMRELISRSEIHIFPDQENVEISHHSVAFLLEGSLKAQDTEDIMTSPTVILHPTGGPDLTFSDITGCSSESSSHSASHYVVVRRARILILDYPQVADGSVFS